jgi:hypothetical protein
LATRLGNPAWQPGLATRLGNPAWQPGSANPGSAKPAGQHRLGQHRSPTPARPTRVGRIRLGWSGLGPRRFGACGSAPASRIVPFVPVRLGQSLTAGSCWHDSGRLGLARGLLCLRKPRLDSVMPDSIRPSCTSGPRWLRLGWAKLPLPVRVVVVWLSYRIVSGWCGPMSAQRPAPFLRRQCLPVVGWARRLLPVGSTSCWRPRWRIPGFWSVRRPLSRRPPLLRRPSPGRRSRR